MEFKLKGADTYYNNGSTWIILTDKKQWVIELTKDGTLWYNFYFFQSILTGLMGFEDTVKNQNYITEWVENFIKNGVKRTDGCQIGTSTSIEDAIQNGVKQTQWGTNQRKNPIEDTIQNGVKRILPESIPDSFGINDAIQNGVKETKHNTFENGLAMQEVIQNGVKKTFGQKMNPILVGDIIKNGINETHDDSYHHKGRVEGVINNGVKETNPHFLEILNPINFEPVTKESKRMNEVNIVLEGGIKETKYCELHSLMRADHIIRDGIKETWGYEKQSQMIVNEVINVGIKETNWRKVDNHPTYVDNIIDKKTLL